MTRSWMALLLLAALLLAGCVAGPNSLVDTASAQGVVAGFWRGLWHGAIAPFTFIGSLFSSGLGVYEVHNNGGWYDFGFVLGLTSLYGSGHAASRRRRR